MINQGLVTENEEGNLAIMRGSRVALKVGKEYGVVEVCKAGLTVLGSDEDFSVAKYKQELAKPYSKVDLKLDRK